MTKILKNPTTGKPIVTSAGKVIVAPTIPDGATTKSVPITDPHTNKVMKFSNGSLIMSTFPTITAPTLSLSGDTLSITDTSGQAESFDLYVDGQFAVNIPKQA